MLDGSREMQWLEAVAKGSYKYYRSRLSEEDKRNYDIVFNAILKREALAKGLKIHPQKIPVLMHHVLRDNPIFYYTRAEYSYNGKGQVWDIKIEYSLSPLTIKRVAGVLMDRVSAYRKVCQGKSNYHIVKYVHDSLIDKVEYSFNTTDPYQAYSVFLTGKAVCEGIAEATKLILDCLGVKCITATGGSRNPDVADMVNHAWNMVDVGGGNFYHMDVTFDENLSDRAGVILSNYFLLTEEQIRETHTFEYDLPSTPQTKIDVFTINRNYYTSYETFRKDFISILNAKARRFHFRFCKTGNPGQVIDNVMKLIQETIKYRRERMYINFKSIDVVTTAMYVEIDYK